MEQTAFNPFEGPNFPAGTLKDMIQPAKSISNKVSVKAALEEMQAGAIGSLPVTDERGQLLGILSKDKMNRNVGGWGHDPRIEPVEAHLEKNDVCCFEDQTVTEAEQIMLKAKVAEIPVVIREKLLVGIINIHAISQAKAGRKRCGV